MRVVGKEKQTAHTGKQLKKKKGLRKRTEKSVKTLNSWIGPALLPGSSGKNAGGSEGVTNNTYRETI